MSRKEQVLASMAIAACVLAQPAQGADLDKLKSELAKEKPGSQSERVLLNALGHESFKAGKKEDGRKYFKQVADGYRKSLQAGESVLAGAANAGLAFSLESWANDELAYGADRKKAEALLLEAGQYYDKMPQSSIQRLSFHKRLLEFYKGGKDKEKAEQQAIAVEKLEAQRRAVDACVACGRG
ncbi:MAG: hypothetical protein K2Y32_01610 [Candidatus Obscuribacterales bacterium]|nr:hypothetical protein [Candidatus Obscuribacterales bacterium]